MCRYAPLGYRGVAPGMIRATKFGLNMKNYFENIEKDLLPVFKRFRKEGFC